MGASCSPGPGRKPRLVQCSKGGWIPLSSDGFGHRHVIEFLPMGSMTPILQLRQDFLSISGKGVPCRDREREIWGKMLLFCAIHTMSANGPWNCPTTSGEMMQIQRGVWQRGGSWKVRIPLTLLDCWVIQLGTASISKLLELINPYCSRPLVIFLLPAQSLLIPSQSFRPGNVRPNSTLGPQHQGPVAGRSPGMGASREWGKLVMGPSRALQGGNTGSF